MKLFRVVCVLLAVVLASAANAAELTAALPVDAAVKIGKLPNGMSYWIRQHKTPPAKVGMWLHISSGSINEEENQRGLAHYLEHLAFNGSTNFPPGELIKYFESIGLRFGQHQNAFTSFDQTTYILSLPDAKDETVGKGFTFLADVGHRMSLLPDEIEKERNVILEEERSRKGAQQRIIDKLLPILAPGSRFAQRMPIGKAEVIKVALKPEFSDYYTKWYHPANSTLIVVGDFPSLEGMEKLITEKFGDWKAVAAPLKDADPGIKPYDSVRAAIITDPELPNAEVSVANISPLRERVTVADFRADVVDSLGNWIVNRRYEELVEKGGAPFLNASASVSPFLNVCRYANAEASGEPQKWESMLSGLLVELKRAREFGFLEQEFEDAKKATLASAEQSSKTESTWDMHALLGRYNNSVAQKRKPMSEVQRLALLNDLLPGITLTEVSNAFKANFAAGQRLVLVTMPEKAGLKVPTEADILAVANKAEAESVAKREVKERPKNLLEAEPTPATVVSQEEDAETKILTATLSNGVKVRLRSMDFKKDEVYCSINIFGGKLAESNQTRGLGDAAGLIGSQPATAKLSSTTIREMMTGKSINVSGGAGDDSLALSVTGAPKDLEEGLRLMYLMVTQGKLEESALKNWKESTKQGIEEQKTSVESQLFMKVKQLLTGDDVRTAMLTTEQVDRVTLEQAQGWYESKLRNGPIEASIVGDMPREDMLKLALKYLGGLPKREGSDGELQTLRRIKAATAALEASVKVATITPRAVVFTGFRGPDWKDVKERRVLQIASQILTARLREEIREKRALTYSIGCMSQPARTYHGAGAFGAFFTADPDKVEEAAKITREVMEKFAAEGPSDTEMDTIRKQFKNTLETQMKEPSYWVQTLSDLDFRPTNLADVKEVQAKMLGYSKEEVQEVCKKYFAADRKLHVIALPEKK